MVAYSGGDGSTIQKAIKISGAANGSEGIAAEYAYLSQRFGQMNKDWMLSIQSLSQDKGRSYDIMGITLADGRKMELFFDITDFFGKM